jgi:hypothetical protein
MIERQFETLRFARNNPAPARDDEIMRPVRALERDQIADQTLVIEIEPHQLIHDLMTIGIAPGAIGKPYDAFGH